MAMVGGGEERNGSRGLQVMAVHNPILARWSRGQSPMEQRVRRSGTPAYACGTQPACSHQIARIAAQQSLPVAGGRWAWVVIHNGTFTGGGGRVGSGGPELGKGRMAAAHEYMVEWRRMPSYSPGTSYHQAFHVMKYNAG